MTPREVRELDLPAHVLLKALNKHQVSANEIHEAVQNGTRIYATGPSDPVRGRVYLMDERTNAGRRLQIVFRRFPGGRCEVITAYPR